MKLEEKLEYLQYTKKPEIIGRIAAAREQGDLSENADYHAAKEDQGFLEHEIRQIREALKRSSQAIKTTDHIGIYSRVKLRRLPDESISKPKDLEYTLVLPIESDPSHGKISIESPIGYAIVGQEIGDQVEVKAPAGIRNYLILEVN